MNYVLFAGLLAGVAYMIGVANHGWTSPLSAVRRAVHGADMSTEDRRSDDVQPEAPDTVDMSGHSKRGGEPEEYGGLTISREHVARQWGIRPELAHLGGHDEDEPQLVSADLATRRAWVRDRIRDGKAPGWINRVGARRFGVDEKTIRRDRAAVEEEESGG